MEVTTVVEGGDREEGGAGAGPGARPLPRTTAGVVGGGEGQVVDTGGPRAGARPGEGGGGHHCQGRLGAGEEGFLEGSSRNEGKSWSV